MNKQDYMDMIKYPKKVIGRKIMYDYTSNVVGAGVITVIAIIVDIVIIDKIVLTIPSLFPLTYTLRQLTNFLVNPEIATGSYLHDAAVKAKVIKDNVR